jgi:hypothetical protein
MSLNFQIHVNFSDIHETLNSNLNLLWSENIFCWIANPLLFWQSRGFDLRASRLLGGCSTTWATPIALYASSCFLDRVLHFCLGILLPMVSCIARITSSHYLDELFCWDGVFLPRLGPNHDLSCLHFLLSSWNYKAESPHLVLNENPTDVLWLVLWSNVQSILVIVSRAFKENVRLQVLDTASYMCHSGWLIFVPNPYTLIFFLCICYYWKAIKSSTTTDLLFYLVLLRFAS